MLTKQTKENLTSLVGSCEIFNINTLVKSAYLNVLEVVYDNYTYMKSWYEKSNQKKEMLEAIDNIKKSNWNSVEEDVVDIMSNILDDFNDQPFIEYYPLLKTFRISISNCMKSDYPNGDMYCGSELRECTEEFHKAFYLFAFDLLKLE